MHIYSINIMKSGNGNHEFRSEMPNSNYSIHTGGRSQVVGINQAIQPVAKETFGMMSWFIWL